MFLFFLLLSATFDSSTLFAQNASLTLSSSSLTIYPGQSNVSLGVTLSNVSYAGPMVVTLTGLPSGVTVTPVVMTAAGSGTLSLSAARNADDAAFSSRYIGRDVVTVQAEAVAAGQVLATATLSLSVSLNHASYLPDPQSIDLPIVTINTGGVAILSKTTNVSGTITVTSADGGTTYFPSSSNTDNTATFHIHGNSSAMMPKVPYAVKLTSGLDLMTTLGVQCPYVNSKGKQVCDKSKSYILLANYDDKTFLRDWAASALANAIPIGNGYLDESADSPTPSGTTTLMPWAPHSLFVELYVNGVYEGNYQLIEKVDIDDNKVNTPELDDDDTSGDLTGGYLVEIDQHQDEDYVFTTPQGVYMGLIDPDSTPEVAEQTSYITNYVDTAENALFSTTYTDPSTGWRAYFDEASLVNFYIVNDVMGNVDGGDFYSSDYYYKPQDNPLLYMGPVWDFDISSGNVNYEPISSPTVPWMQTEARWYKRLFTDPGFQADVKQQWNTLKNNGVFDTWLTSIQTQAQTLEQSQANNFGRWPIQSIKVWPNIEAAGSYDGEVAYLIDWLKLRIAYLDSLFNDKTQTTISFTAPGGTLREGVAATLEATVTGGTAESGSVTFLSNGTVLASAALDGSGYASATASLPAGSDTLTAVYSGDETNALSSSSATPVTVLAPLAPTTTSLSYGLTGTGAVNPDALVVTVLANSGTTAPTGTATVTVDGQAATSATLVAGTAGLAMPDLMAGSHTVQVVYGGDLTYQTSTSNSLAIAAAAPTMGLTSSLNPAFSSTQVTLTATVTSTKGTPTGTVTFYNGSVALGSATTLSASGTATLTTSALPVGTSAVTASYSGDTLFPADTSSALSQEIDDFGLALASGSASTIAVKTGQSASFQVVLSPTSPATSFPAAITLSVSGGPSGATYTISPSTVAAGAGATTATVTVQTAASTTTARNDGAAWRERAGPLGLAVLLLPWAVRLRRRGRMLATVLLFGLGLAGTLLLNGCGLVGGSASGQGYTLTVTAASGSLSHTTSVSLQVR